MRSAILWKTLFATTFRPAQERKNTNQMAELRVERGAGVAASPVSGLLVVCGENSDTLSAYDMRLSHVATFGGRYWGASGFNFNGCVVSGFMAFTEDTPHPLLLVTAAGHGTVHVIDVVAQTRVGYVGTRGSVPGPRGVAVYKEIPGGRQLLA